MLVKQLTATGFMLSISLLGHSALAQDVPEQCVQLPQRTLVCPNLIYKRAPLSLPSLSVVEGEMVCVCMADFNIIRIAAETEQEKVNELVELGKLAHQLGISESELISLIRD